MRRSLHEGGFSKIDRGQCLWRYRVCVGAQQGHVARLRVSLERIGSGCQFAGGGGGGKASNPSAEVRTKHRLPAGDSLQQQLCGL